MRRKDYYEEDEEYSRQNDFDPDDPDFEGDDEYDEEYDEDGYDDDYDDDPDGDPEEDYDDDPGEDYDDYEEVEYEDEGFGDDEYIGAVKPSKSPKASKPSKPSKPSKNPRIEDEEEYDDYEDDGGPMQVIMRILGVLVALAIVAFLGIFLWQTFGRGAFEKEEDDGFATEEDGEVSGLSVVNLSDLLGGSSDEEEVTEDEGTKEEADAPEGSGDQEKKEEVKAADPTQEPKKEAAAEPKKDPTPEPTKEPTPSPTPEPTPEPTKEPTPAPTEEPKKEATPEPTKAPEGTQDAGASASDMKFTEVNDTVTAKDRTNLRDKPSQGEDSTVIYTLPNGETVKRTGVSDSGWSKLVYNDKTVYAVTSYLTTDLTVKEATPAPEASADDGVKTKFETRDEQVTPKNSVNLRKLPSVTNPDAEVVATIEKGTVITRTGINEDVGWSRVTYDGKTLYCVSSYIELAGN